MATSGLLQSIQRGFERSIRDPVWGDIPCTPAIVELLRQEAFVRADGIRQLGPVSFVYPGATHTRTSHSLGVYHVARRLSLSLLERGQMDFVSKEGLMSFLIAALCHDIGHYPYAHSLKELPLVRHESLTASMLAPATALAAGVAACGADPSMVAAIIDDTGDAAPAAGYSARTGADREVRFFRRLLSGVLDPDKIDYLTRDAYFCGVPYGVQDADFILRHIMVGPDDIPGVDEQGMISVEGLLFSKYLMYRSVYWHRTVRAATSMVRKALSSALDSGSIAAEALYGLDDHDFAVLLAGNKDPALEPARLALAGKYYSLAAEIPFDDANPVHGDLLKAYGRREAEAAFAAAAGLSDSDVVVDIPEPVSFEADLPVYTAYDTRAFADSDTVFKPDVVARFPKTLRRVRVFLREASLGAKDLALAMLA